MTVRENVPSCPSQVLSDNIEDYDFGVDLGRGNFGSVCEAVDRTSGRKCAIKTIFKTNNPSRIESEVLIHKRASNHDNIARLFKATEDDKNVYLVLELCSGGSLKDLIATAVEKRVKRSPSKSSCSGYGSLRKSFSSSCMSKSISPRKMSFLAASSLQTRVQPVLSVELIRSIFRQICCGLEFLHRNNVVHRDLNVNNLMFETRFDPDSRRAHEDVKIKIIDFGLALDMKTVYQSTPKGIPGRVTTTKRMAGGTICGTAGFISPEVYFQSAPASPASDVFALGSILYSMVTGVKPPEKVDLSSFPPDLSSLICLLWMEDPDQRMPVKDLLEHPFILGPICTKRLQPTLPPILAKNQEMSINEDLSVTVKFLDKGCSITVSKDSSRIFIRTRQSDRAKEYAMDTLPFLRWKWFARVHDFIRGIKAMTPKIKKFVEAGDNSHHKVSSIDSKGNRLTIFAGILTEASTFKAFVRDDITGVQSKVMLSDSLKEKNPVLHGQVKELYEKCLRLEETMESLGENEGEDYFPLTCGKNSIKNCHHSDQRRHFHGKENHVDNSLTLSSSSLTFEDVVKLDMFPANRAKPDGLQVDWRDGSSMYFFHDGKITYRESSRRPERVIQPTDHLTTDVKRKMAMMPLLYKRAVETKKSSLLRDNSNSLNHHHHHHHH